MTTTTKVILICSLAGACALALWPRAAGGAGTRMRAIPISRFATTPGASCALGEIGVLRDALRFERAAPTRMDACAIRLS